MPKLNVLILPARVMIGYLNLDRFKGIYRAEFNQRLAEGI